MFIDPSTSQHESPLNNVDIKDTNSPNSPMSGEMSGLSPAGASTLDSGSSLASPTPSSYFGSRRSSLTSQEGGDVLKSHPVFVRDSSQFWYKPSISREEAIALLKDKPPGTFVVRDSNSFPGAFGLALRVAELPANVAASRDDSLPPPAPEDLVRHFLIEPTSRGVRLKGCSNEPTFGSLAALIYQHSITPLALPCKVAIPTIDIFLGGEVVEGSVEVITPPGTPSSGRGGRGGGVSSTSPPSHGGGGGVGGGGVTSSSPNSMTEDESASSPPEITSTAQLLTQGAACNVLYLNTVEMESLTGPQAVKKAMNVTLDGEPTPTPTIVHFKVSSQGITLTDSQRKLFFRRHYPVNTITYCGTDPEDKRCFGFVARKPGSSRLDNQCHVFAELDADQPSSAIVSFVTKVLIRSSATQFNDKGNNPRNTPS